MNQPFLDLLSADEAALWNLLDTAQAIKASPGKFADALRGRVLYGLYQKTSTRTHVSFSKAAALVGCAYIHQSWADSNFSISDTSFEAQYIGRVADFFMARLRDHEHLRAIAAAADIPVINGCCNKFHPMQALADAFTLLEYFGALGGQRFLYLGVANNMLNSLAAMLTTLGVQVVAFTPEVNASAQDERVTRLMADSPLFERVDDLSVKRLRDEVRRADVVYVDTWIDMENYAAPDMAEANATRVELLRRFSLTTETYGDSDAVIMHCMPIHPGFEIDRALVNHPNSIIFDQADSRTYVQAATLMTASKRRGLGR
jgi:ornithine carbamoyltransferase